MEDKSWERRLEEFEEQFREEDEELDRRDQNDFIAQRERARKHFKDRGILDAQKAKELDEAQDPFDLVRLGYNVYQDMMETCGSEARRRIESLQASNPQLLAQVTAKWIPQDFESAKME